ncbi:hypothetical protein ACLEU9_23630 [Escherichia coli]
MKKILFCSLLLLSASSFAQQFHYQCEGRDLKIMLSPNAAFLDGKWGLTLSGTKTHVKGFWS